MGRIIKRNKSIIPACDVSFKRFEELIKETSDIEKVGAYKVGSYLGLSEGLKKIVDTVRDYGEKPVIYDHQKAGTDIPDLGLKFADVLDSADVDAAIIFPQSGPETEKAWIKSLQDKDIGVILGGIMTHPKYLRSEGGYIADEAVMEIYLTAADCDVNNFIVPGDKPDEIKRIRKSLEERGITPTIYAPGFIKQGGEISEAVNVVGDRWHAIVGRGIYESENIREAAIELTNQI